MTSEFLRASQHAYGWVTAISGSANTRSAYLTDIQAFFSWLKIAGVASPLLATEAMISEYIASLTEASRGESVVRRSLSAIRSYYQFLADDGHVVSNPAAAVQHPPVIQGALQILSVGDAERILDGAHRRAREAKPGSAKAISLARSAAMLETLYSGGLEVSELCALPSSLDLSRAGIHQLQIGNGARRSVIINARALDAIRFWRDAINQYGSASDAWLFHSVRYNTRPIARTQMHRDCAEAAEHAGIKLGFGVSPAVLPDSMVVHLLQRGMPIMHVAQLLGYTDMTPMARFIQDLQPN